MKQIIIAILVILLSTAVYGTNFRYLTFEVYDHYGSNSTTISEIKIHDTLNNVLGYSVVSIYDSTTNGVPSYWNTSLWSKSNLYDGSINYTSNATGKYSTTLFNYASSANTGQWSRFVLDLGGIKNVGTIDVWSGSPEVRMPHFIDMWGSDSYSYATNVQTRNDTGLTYITELEYVSTQTSVFLTTVDVESELQGTSGIPEPNSLVLVIAILGLGYFLKK